MAFDQYMAEQRKTAGNPMPPLFAPFHTVKGKTVYLNIYEVV